MITLTCYGCEDVARECCGSAAVQECFSGLLVDDTGIETLIYSPFSVFLNSSGALVADNFGHYATIAVSGSEYATIADLEDYLKSCACGQFIEYFDNFTGSILQVTKNNGILPTDDGKVFVDLNGQLIHGGGRDYTVNSSGGQIVPVGGWTFNNANAVVRWNV